MPQSESIYSDLLAGVNAAVVGLNLTYTPEGTTAPVNANVVVRKLPRVEENLGDTLPLIAICPKDTPERIEVASAESESGVFKWYVVEIVVIAAGNQDFVSNMPAYFSWREQIMRSFQSAKPVDVYGLYDTEMRPEVPIDRNRVNANYDYQGITVVFKCLEPRNNKVAAAVMAA